MKSLLTPTPPKAPTSRLAPLALLLVGLAGCAAQPLPKPELATPAAWRHAAPAPDATIPLQTWWKGFQDAALDQLVARALRENLDLAQAVERLRAARVLREHSGARYLPYLRAKTDEVVNPNASASYLVSGFDAVWEFGLFGRREGTARMTQGELDEAGATLEAARVSLIGEVVANYLMWAATRERLLLLQQSVDAQQQQLSLLRVRVSLGLAAPLQLAEASAQLAKSTGAGLQAGQQADALAQQLALLLGQAQPDPAWLPGQGLPEHSPAAVVSTPAELLRSRPEIRRAEAQVLLAAGEADIARADRLPNLGIGGTVVWSTNIARNRRESDFDISSIGPLVDIPLFDWGLRKANADAKAHLLKAAVLAYRQAVLRGYAEVEIALGNLEQLRAREAAESESAAVAQHTVELVRQRVGLSLASPLDAQAALAALAQAQLARVDVATEHALAYVALFKALGGAPLPSQAEQP
jgi:NodT family efflux transporter outer membrane factor (OMF) lipoprotein